MDPSSQSSTCSRRVGSCVGSCSSQCSNRKRRSLVVLIFILKMIAIADMMSAFCCSASRKKAGGGMTEWLKMKLRETDLKISTWPKMIILTIALFILSILTMMVSSESANWRLRVISNSELPSYFNSSSSLLNGSATKSINITFSRSVNANIQQPGRPSQKKPQSV